MPKFRFQQQNPDPDPQRRTIGVAEATEATTMDHRCGSRAGAGLDSSRSWPGGLHHQARAPHGHHGHHRGPFRAGDLAALLRRRALTGRWRHTTRSRHLRARADGYGCDTVHILLCTVPHPPPTSKAGAGPASRRPDPASGPRAGAPSTGVAGEAGGVRGILRACGCHVSTAHRSRFTRTPTRPPIPVHPNANPSADQPTMTAAPVRPPSTSRTAPWTKAASSEAR
jgi:hypothetical protein